MAFALVCLASCSSDTITVTYNGNTAKVSTIKNDSISVKVKNADVQITNKAKSEKLTFVLKGESDNGSFSLKSANEANVELSNLNLTSNEGAPLTFKGKNKVNVIAKDKTTNSLTITACEDTANHKPAVIHSKGELTISGKGYLTVLATGKGCKGINAKKSLSISDLTLDVTTTGMYLAEDTTHHGFGGPMPAFNPDDMPEEMKAQFEEMRKRFEEMAKNGEMPQFPGMPNGGPMGGPMGGPGGGFPPMGNNDSIPHMGGGFPPMGEGAPGMGGGMPPMMGEYIGVTKAIKSLGSVTINSGNITVNTSTPGAEGVEGKKGVIVNDGTLYIKAMDDAINANDQIYFNGGTITAISTNNDAIDSNIEGGFPMFFGGFGGNNNDQEKKEQKPAIIINGGTVYAWSHNGSPEEGLDCDFSPIEISGGSVFSIGGGMGEMPSVPTNATAKQPTVLVLGLKIKADEKIELYDADANGNATGSPLESYTPVLDFNGSASIISSPSFKVGKKYILKSASTTRLIEIKENFTICRP